MTMNSSGPISLGGSTAGQSINLENGLSATAQVSLNDTAVRSLAGVTTPNSQIIMPTNFYGKSNLSVFVAAGSGATGAYSLDNGATWASSTMPGGAGNWFAIAWGGGSSGKFFAAKQNTTTVAYSSNGQTWTSATLPVSNNWRCAAYGGGNWIILATGSPTNNYLTSTDGTNWTARTYAPPGGFSPSSVTWSSTQNQFVAIDSGRGAAYTSPTGVTWTQAATAPANQSWNQVAWGTANGGLYVSGAPSGTGNLAYSSTGASWTTTAPFGTNVMNNVSYNPTYNRWVMLAASNNAYWSSNGTSWNLVSTSTGTGPWYMSTFGAGVVVCVGFNASVKIATTTDGTVWTNRTTGVPAVTYFCCAYGPVA